MEATRNVAMNECPVCGVNKGKKLQRHLFDVHEYSKKQISEFKAQKRNRRVAASGKSVYNCEYCDATFNSMSGLGRHRGAKHAVEYSAPAIICPICRESVKSHRELAEHAHQQHAENSDDFVVETIRFQDLQDYKSWKLASEEAGVISRFITRTKTTEHAKVTYLRCHCSFYCPSSPPQKTKKSVPYCTAYMNVTERIDGVTVEHCLTHLGHEALPSQLRLDENAEKYIVSLLKDGLTVQQVHKKIRMHVGGGPRTRLYFTTTRDIRNLAAKSRVQRGKLNNLDAASVQMQVDAKSEFDGRRSHEAVTVGSSAFPGNIGEEVQSSDRDEEMMTNVTIKDYRNDEKVPRTSADMQDSCSNIFQAIEMGFASIRTNACRVLETPSEDVILALDQVKYHIEKARKIMEELAEGVKRSQVNMSLARRTDVFSVGRPKALTPIRELYKRSHLLKEEQAKRKPTINIPDCLKD